jgi:sugar lactone lactonase YvrE
MKRVSLLLLVGIVVLVAVLITRVHAAFQVVSQVVTFDQSLGQLPESIAIDKRGNIYVSFLLTGEIREITPDGAQSTLAILGTGPTTPYPGRRLSGLAVDAPGNIYALLNDVPATAGVWRISPDGTALLFASIPFASGLNALAFDKRGSLFVSDPFLAAIYRVGSDGSVDVWLTDPLLQGITPSTCGTPFPGGPRGANGIAFDKKGDMFVLNTTQGLVVRIAVLPDGSPAAPETFVGPTCDLVGLDGQAFDDLDNLYVAVNIQNKIVRIDPNGGMTTIAAAPDDPLVFPTAIAFETGLGQRKEIFITNFAVLGGTPGIAKMDVGLPGRPLP